MKYLLATLALAAAPAFGQIKMPDNMERRNELCVFFAETVLVGQNALDEGVPQEVFDLMLAKALAVPELDQAPPIYRQLVRRALTRGYSSVARAHMGIIAQKAYDDCIVGKP